MTLHPTELPKQNPEQGKSYLEKIGEIIMKLPKSYIRNFPYITKSVNPQHKEACSKIYRMIEELETKLTKSQEKRESIKKTLMGLCTSEELENEAYEREEMSIREAEAYDSVEEIL